MKFLSQGCKKLQNETKFSLFKKYLVVLQSVSVDWSPISENQRPFVLHVRQETSYSPTMRKTAVWMEKGLVTETTAHEELSLVGMPFFLEGKG